MRLLLNKFEYEYLFMLITIDKYLYSLFILITILLFKHPSPKHLLFIIYYILFIGESEW